MFYPLPVIQPGLYPLGSSDMVPNQGTQMVSLVIDQKGDLPASLYSLQYLIEDDVSYMHIYRNDSEGSKIGQMDITITIDGNQAIVTIYHYLQIRNNHTMDWVNTSSVK